MSHVSSFYLPTFRNTLQCLGLFINIFSPGVKSAWGHILFLLFLSFLQKKMYVTRPENIQSYRVEGILIYLYSITVREKSGLEVRKVLLYFLLYRLLLCGITKGIHFYIWATQNFLQIYKTSTSNIKGKWVFIKTKKISMLRTLLGM